MSQEHGADIAIVGAGIVGLAHAYMALKKGYRVVLFERDEFAIGASIRNFGLIWPIGQQPGVGLELALASRRHWVELCKQSGIWINENGSLHIANHDDEFCVLEEFCSLYKDAAFDLKLLSKNEINTKSKYLNQKNLKGGLWSSTECTVNPREAIHHLPQWLHEKFGLILKFGSVVNEISLPILKTSRETWRVDKVFVCSGVDFETLYPEAFFQHQITKCKLQMMKAAMPTVEFILGPSLCAGLTLRHYDAFAKCPSLQKVSDKYDQENPVFKKYGIHVLISQNNFGELIIGDSHEYGKTLDPFTRTSIDETILTYLSSFMELGKLEITERWQGIYPKMQGSINMEIEAAPGVTIVNGLGGAGMTLSFGIAEKNINRL